MSLKPERSGLSGVALATVAGLALMAGAFSLRGLAHAEEPGRRLPEAAMTTKETGLRTATLAGDCFWGVQGVFQHVRGVKQAVSGYAGGDRSTAQYNRVEDGDTGHAESVEITYDPHKITYGKLLQIFFSVAHDPTDLNRQGPDSGTQYRSTIFAQTPEQQKIAAAYIAQLNKAHVYSDPIVTRVDRLTAFYPAEDYHQDYLIHNPDSGYIVVNDLPKIGNLKRIYPELYSEKPVMVASR